VWSNGTGWPIAEDDLETFKVHMDDWYSLISQGPMSRKDYEEACQKRSIKPFPDDSFGGYGDLFGDFGMSHYHTEPENRLIGIAATLNQKRWYGLLKENPNIQEQREKADQLKREEARLAKLRETYPEDLDAFLLAVGGLEAIYNKAADIHSNNSHVLREEGRHFEWLIGNACMSLGMKFSHTCSGYVESTSANGWQGVYPLLPKWWAGWDESDPIHPINRVAEMLKDKRIEPYMGKVTYIGYGEDCGDDVRKNAKDWLGI
jgi:hypothetical protein